MSILERIITLAVIKVLEIQKDYDTKREMNYEEYRAKVMGAIHDCALMYERKEEQFRKETEVL